MRTVLARLLSMFLPARGRRRAGATAPPPPVCPPKPASPPRDVIAADDMPLVRPYLLAWERERERRAQRDRRRAAVLATMGQDYLPGVAV